MLNNLVRLHNKLHQLRTLYTTRCAFLSASFLFSTKQLRPVIWPGERGTNWLDGGSAFYGTYKTKDDKYVSLGALEPQFYRDLLIGT